MGRLEEQGKNVSASFGRALLAADIFGKFYDNFLKSHPDIPKHFVNTDLDKQKHLLKHGLNLVIMMASGNTFGKSGLTRIRKSHNQDHLNIHPQYYTFWKDAMLQTISEADPQFDQRLLADWNAVLQYAIDFLSSGYHTNKAMTN